MDLSIFKKLSIGNVELRELYIDGVLAWKGGYKNWVRHSINTDGSIYNGGLGYKNGSRIRSGGAEGATTTGTHTGYIPVKANDVIRISGCEFSAGRSENAINISNSSFTNLGQMAMNSQWAYGSLEGTTYGDYTKSVTEETPGVWKWVVPPASYNVAYIRVSAYKSSGGDGASLIVTVNEEIT